MSWLPVGVATLSVVNWGSPICRWGAIGINAAFDSSMESLGMDIVLVWVLACAACWACIFLQVIGGTFGMNKPSLELLTSLSIILFLWTCHSTPCFAVVFLTPQVLLPSSISQIGLTATSSFSLATLAAFVAAAVCALAVFLSCGQTFLKCFFWDWKPACWRPPSEVIWHADVWSCMPTFLCVNLQLSCSINFCSWVRNMVLIAASASVWHVILFTRLSRHSMCCQSSSQVAWRDGCVRMAEWLTAGWTDHAAWVSIGMP